MLAIALARSANVAMTSSALITRRVGASSLAIARDDSASFACRP